MEMMKKKMKMMNDTRGGNEFIFVYNIFFLPRLPNGCGGGSLSIPNIVVVIKKKDIILHNAMARGENC